MTGIEVEAPILPIGSIDPARSPTDVAIEPWPHAVQCTSIPVPAAGTIRRPVRIVHITDSHLCRVTEDDGIPVQTSSSLAALFTGRHPTGSPPEDTFAAMLSWSDALPADVVVLTGDTVHYPVKSLVAAAVGRTAAICAPVVYCPGNHDWHDPREPWNEDTRRRYLPSLAPLMARQQRIATGTWRYDAGGIAILLFDNSTYQFSQEQARVLDAAINDPGGDPLLVFYHIPICTPELVGPTVDEWRAPILVDADAHWIDDARAKWKVAPATAATKRFVELLRTAPPGRVLGAFCGHLHLNHESRLGTVTQSVTAGGFSGQLRFVFRDPSSLIREFDRK